MTVFILHYANDALTNACAREWMQQGPSLVIDNGSPVPYVPDCGVQVMRLEHNLNLIDANNAAAKVHLSDWYLFPNNDVFPEKGCLAKLLRRFEDTEVGIVAPGSSDTGAGVLYVPYPDDALPDVATYNVDNHCWMFTQDVIDEIGYPDAEGHTHRACWYANKLYCWKARHAGYKVVAVRSAYVEHRRAKGYDYEADMAGRRWIKERLGARVQEAW